MPTPCPVCSGSTETWATATVLGDTEATYLRCSSCGLVFVDDATWLERAYSEAISGLDTGLLNRCVVLSNITAALLRSEGLPSGRFLDWAGGYGTLTRLMRDRGYAFVDLDPFATNVFAGPHRLDAITPGDRFDAVTAFEVLEHLNDPLDTLGAVAATTDVLVVTTQLLPSTISHPHEWDYFSLESGQHIAFHTEQSLAELGRRLGYSHVTTGPLVHLFQRRRPPRGRTRMLLRSPKAAYMAGVIASVPEQRHSLTEADSLRHRASLGL
jgi:hypothetical protein